jgi:hypothetical protein
VEAAMTVRCSKCGEELMGAVNRCWKCGQMFAQRPEIDGRPPVRAEAIVDQPPLEAVVLGDAPAGDAVEEAAVAVATAVPQPVPTLAPSAALTAAQIQRLTRTSTSDMIDAKRSSLMAMGGTVGSLVLGLFALALALFRFEAALIALLGLLFGIWGLYSPRRPLAFAAMLLCCLAIALGSYTGANQLRVYIKNRQPIVDDYNPAGARP